MKKVFGVMGGGSWGTALVKILSENCEKINWYVRNQENVDYINKFKCNPNYLSSISLKMNKINVYSSIEYVTKKSDILVLAIPSPFLNSEIKKIENAILDKHVFSALKGVVPESHLVVSEHLNQKYGVPLSNIGIITGPCHAEEVALEKLSYLTVANQDAQVGQFVKKSLQTKFINSKLSNDNFGVEYAAMLKNIYALVAGISNGLGYGDNFQSVLISNSVQEMKKFIRIIYKVKRNINGSEYLGDLLVTSYSSFSRNRTLGNMIGKGYSINSAISEMNMISEGYYATKNAYEIGLKNNTKFEIIETAYEILYNGKSPKKYLKDLSEKLNWVIKLI